MGGKQQTYRLSRATESLSQMPEAWAELERTWLKSLRTGSRIKNGNKGAREMDDTKTSAEVTQMIEKPTRNRKSRFSRRRQDGDAADNRGDLVKMRIDGLHGAAGPDIVWKFCSAFGEVSALELRSSSEGDFWALVELRQPEQYKRLWAEWLDPRMFDGLRVRVESDVFRVAME
jgi:hypothetical protein